VEYALKEEDGKADLNIFIHHQHGRKIGIKKNENIINTT